jgi:hypothetical protein
MLPGLVSSSVRTLLFEVELIVRILISDGCTTQKRVAGRHHNGANFKPERNCEVTSNFKVAPETI